MKLITTLMLALTLAFGACKKSDEKAEGSGAPKQEEKKTEGGHGAHGAVPGSHDDWCGEHAVAESQCTRCDPSLAAAFKATGDWCEEHGLPESQCLKCNPDLKIVRPPKE